MGIGASLFLIALGAILAFGVNVDTSGVLNLNVIGWVLMLVGAFSLALTMSLWQRRRVVSRRVVETRPTVTNTPTREAPAATVVEQPETVRTPDGRFYRP